jgi:membrane carboxypeptidase/penicillin-binding protein PbpC
MKNVSGISGAAPLFRSIMLLLHRDHDPEPFPVPDNLVSCPVCPLSGQRPGLYCEGHIEEWFAQGTEPSQSCTVHQNVAIDRQSGQLATNTTPENNIDYRVYTVWPAPYHDWMASRNLPILPDTTSLHQPKPVILFPDDGDIFKIDPILRPEYQVLHFSAQIPAHVDTVQWILDNKLLAQTPFPFTLSWPMTPGQHRLSVHIPDQTSSTEITFQVLP